MLTRQTYFALGVTAALSACDAPTVQANTAEKQPTFSHAKLDPGSKAKPSNKYSRELFEMNDQVRLAMFRKFMVASGEQCDLVTGAV